MFETLECDFLPMISMSGPIFEGPYPFFYDVSTDTLFNSPVDTGAQPGIFRLHTDEPSWKHIILRYIQNSIHTIIFTEISHNIKTIFRTNKIMSENKIDNAVSVLLNMESLLCLWYFLSL